MTGTREEILMECFKYHSMERVLREKGSRDEIEFYCHMLCNFEMQLYAYHEDAAIVGETYKDNDVVLIS